MSVARDELGSEEAQVMDLELLGSATDTRTFHWINSERHLGQRCFCLEILERKDSNSA